MKIAKVQYDEELNDINELVKRIALTAIKPMLEDAIWQPYGYRHRPTHGALWEKLFPRMFRFENYVRDEILIMSLIDALNGIKKSSEGLDEKLIISLGVIDQFLSILDNTFDDKKLMDDLFSMYSSYLTSEKSKKHEPIILKAQNELNRKEYVKFMVGTIKLLAMGDSREDYLIKSDYIKDMIENSRKENRLGFLMSKDFYIKYAPLIEDRILNS